MASKDIKTPDKPLDEQEEKQAAARAAEAAKDDERKRGVLTPPDKPQGAYAPLVPNMRTGVGVPEPESLGSREFVVTKRSFVNGSLVEAGQVVRLPDGVEPGKHMEPVPGSRRGSPTQEQINRARAAATLSGEPTTPASAKGQEERQNRGGIALSQLKQTAAKQEGPEAERRLADERAEEYAEQQKNAVKEPELNADKRRASAAAGRRLVDDSKGAHESDDSNPI